jgi:Uma2 family endonuclease
MPMAAATTHLLTVEEFRKLPEDTGAVYHELRHGEVVAVTRPKLKHVLIQSRLRDLLQQFAPTDSLVESTMAFRPLPEHELWVADVAYLSAERFRQADPEDNIRGAPELVIEVLSPSNTASEILDKKSNSASPMGLWNSGWWTGPAPCASVHISRERKALPAGRRYSARAVRKRQTGRKCHFRVTS